MADIPKVLYHYTSREGYEGILDSGVIKPYGEDQDFLFGREKVGQYFTDISPKNVFPNSRGNSDPKEYFTLKQLSQELFCSPLALTASNLKYCFKINVSELPIIWCWEERYDLFKHTYIHESDRDLDISTKIISHGEV
jgi:HYD1 signature containing ADP-ribosyltransferase